MNRGATRTRRRQQRTSAKRIAALTMPLALLVAIASSSAMQPRLMPLRPVRPAALAVHTVCMCDAPPASSATPSIKQLEEAISELQETLEQKSVEYYAISDGPRAAEERRALQVVRDTLKEDIDAKEAEVFELQQKNAASPDVVTKLRGREVALENQIASARMDADTARQADFEAQLAELRDELKEVAGPPPKKFSAVARMRMEDGTMGKQNEEGEDFSMPDLSKIKADGILPPVGGLINIGITFAVVAAATVALSG